MARTDRESSGSGGRPAKAEGTNQEGQAIRLWIPKEAPNDATRRWVKEEGERLLRLREELRDDNGNMDTTKLIRRARAEVEGKNR